MAPDIDSGSLAGAALDLTERAAAARWRGPDAYDGLWWRWPRWMVGGRWRRTALMQVHVRCPLDVRKLYRREHPLVPKALGIFGSVGLRLQRLTGDERAGALGLDALDTLAADRRAGDFAWGYHWDMQTRWSFYPAGSPSIVHTAFAVSGLLEAERDADRADLGERGRRAARWVLDELWTEPGGYFAYHPRSAKNIHNANMLGAWLAFAALGDDAEVRERVLRALERTLAGQRPDGSWPYGEEPNTQWADSFHSGYVLLCLERLRDLDPRVDEALVHGARHFEQFFDARGRGKLWAHTDYPEDAHSAGTGLTTLALLLRRGLVGPELLHRVAARLLDAGIRDGHAVFRRYRVGSSRVHYLRWCDAHVALGLADSALALAGLPDLAPGPRAFARPV